jgi:tetratricopeptide (TPR) repeat protein
MVENSHKKDADYFEKYARIYLRDKDYHKVTKAYENAGDYWEKKGEIRNALKDYEDALRYVQTKEDKDRIHTKIGDLHFERGKILGRLGQIKHDIENKKPLRKPHRGLLEDKLFVLITSISLLSFSLFFSLFSLTGNTISILSQEDFRWMGLCLFLCGLILSFFYLRGRK